MVIWIANKDLEISKDGIKLSYSRFLSDISAGLIILIASIAYYYPLISKIPTNLQIFVFVLLFLLSMPLGLAVNTISWIILGSLAYKFEVFWFNKNWFFIKNSKILFEFDICKEFFNLNKDNWIFITRRFEIILIICYPDHIERFDYIEGIKIFFRNAGFLSFIFIIFLVPDGKMSVLILLSVILLIISSIMSFYRYLAILNYAYILCLKFNHNKENKIKCDINKMKGDINKIIDHLLST